MVALVGAGFTARGVVDCRRDLEAVRHAADYLPGGGREIVARQYSRNMMDRLILLIVFAMIGMIALFNPVTAHQANNPPISMWLSSLGFLFAEIRLTYAAYLDRGVRRDLKRDMRRRTDPPAGVDQVQTRTGTLQPPSP